MGFNSAFKELKSLNINIGVSKTNLQFETYHYVTFNTAVLVHTSWTQKRLYVYSVTTWRSVVRSHQFGISVV